MENMHATPADFWDQHYREEQTPWDLGTVSPAIKGYIDQLTDKHSKILIPGCGNSYEAEYLLDKGFDDITLIDISPELIEKLKKKFKAASGLRLIQGNFFDHEGKYDLILEQTFFCALDPGLRKKYVQKMVRLLNPKGKLAGVLFNKQFHSDGPPFGGSQEEYESLFGQYFTIRTLALNYNSFPKRRDQELFMIMEAPAPV